MDSTNFQNPAGFGFDLKIFKSVELDLSFLKVLDLHLDIKIAGFGFDMFKSTNPPTNILKLMPTFQQALGGLPQCIQAA